MKRRIEKEVGREAGQDLQVGLDPGEGLEAGGRSTKLLEEKLITYAYANLFNPSADPLCPLCKEEPQTIEHWLRKCPKFDATRKSFSTPQGPYHRP